MKILHIRDSLHGGGAERVVVELSEGSVNLLGDSVTIFLTRDKISYEVDPSISVIVSDIPKFILNIEFGLKKIMGSFAYLFTSYMHRYYLNKKINIKEFDFIYIHSITSLLSFWSLKGRNVFSVYHCSKSNLLLEGRSLLSKLKNKFMLRLSACAKGRISVSEGVARDLSQSFNIDCKNVIYNPFNRDKIIEKSLVEECSIIELGNYILSIGRLDHQKNHEELIIAFSKIHSHYDFLVILGEGPLKKDLYLLVNSLNLSSKVVFLGFVDNPYNYMKSAAMLLLTSKFEGFGNVLVEALLVNCPVISANCDHGPKEILIGNLSSYLYPPGDVDYLCKLMLVVSTTNYPFDDFDCNKFSLRTACNSYINVVYND